jgi:hypothetical protein
MLNTTFQKWGAYTIQRPIKFSQPRETVDYIANKPEMLFLQASVCRQKNKSARTPSKSRHSEIAYC